MTTIGPKNPVTAPVASETPAAPAATTAPAGPATEATRPAPAADAFDSAPAVFVDRPTGLRPGDPRIVATPPAFQLGESRALATPAKVIATATPNAAIEDLKTTTSSLEVTDDVTVDQLKLNLDLAHTYRGDLTVKVTSPSGKTATVSDRAGGSADDLKGPFDLSAFAGEKAKGTWTITVEDKAKADVGTLKSWGVEITPKETTEPKPPEPKPTSGDPIVVVLDGGVDAKHTDLDDSMWTNPNEVEGDGIDNDQNGIVDDVHGFNVGDGSGDVSKGDGNDHGTHVAGIIAAEDNGQGNTGVAAGKAKVLAIGGLYDGADLLTNFERSVDYVVQQKAAGANIRVLSCSFGDTFTSPAELARWDAACKKLLDADILVCAATANGNGSDMDKVPGDRPSNLDSPNVLSIAAMDRNNDKLARFSSFGKKTVDLAAQGEDILSTVPGNRWSKMSGTSMATPLVSGTAALLFAINPKLTASQARDILLQSVEKDSDLTNKVATGGKLNVAAALELARKSLPPAEVAPAAREEWFTTAAAR